MGTVQDNRFLVREPSVVLWCGGSRLFTERFASATARVASRRAGNGAKGQVDSPLSTLRWLLMGRVVTLRIC